MAEAQADGFETPRRDSAAGSSRSEAPVGLPNSVRASLRAAVARLAAAGVPSPQADVWELAAQAWLVADGGSVPAFGPAGGDPATSSGQEVRRRLALDPEARWSSEVAQRFAALVAHRAQRVPLQHLTGRAAFRHLELEVGPGVFIPRPESEVTVQVVLAELRRLRRTQLRASEQESDRVPLVVDLGTGSGAIALAVATEAPGSTVIGVENSPAALSYARRNNARYGNAVRLICGDVVAGFAELATLAARVDVVVANPPYIPPFAIPRDPEVADYDPPEALFGQGPDGLAIPAAFAQTAARLLAPGGLFVMEHGDAQGAAVRELLTAVGGFERMQTHRDLTGRDRMVVARRAIA